MASEDRVQPPGRPGWKQDPNDPAVMRYWDGAKWGDGTVPRVLTRASRRRLLRSAGAVALFGMAVLCIVVGVWGFDAAERECRDSRYYETCINDGSAGPAAAILFGLMFLAICLALAIRALHRHRKSQRRPTPETPVDDCDQASH